MRIFLRLIFIQSKVRFAILIAAMSFYATIIAFPKGILPRQKILSLDPLIRYSQFRLLSMKNIESYYLKVPFNEKDEVKTLGAMWDSQAKSWYPAKGLDYNLFKKWMPIYLKVPFDEKDEVKKLGAFWDPLAKKWHINANNDVSAFEKWIDSSYKGVPVDYSKIANNNKVSQPNKAPTVDSSESSIQSDSVSVVANAQSSEAKYEQAIPVETSSSKDLIVLINIDTNGLPLHNKGQYASPEDLVSYDNCRIVRLSYYLCRRNDFSIVNRGSYIVKSDGFPIDNTEFHGVTLAKSEELGTSFIEISEKLSGELSKADFVLAHNAEFVFNVLKSELFRHGLLDELALLESRQAHCSMQQTSNILGLLDKRGSIKKPSLKELVNFTLQTDLPAQRGANVDIEYLRKALATLSENNQFKI